MSEEAMVDTAKIEKDLARQEKEQLLFNAQMHDLVEDENFQRFVEVVRTYLRQNRPSDHGNVERYAYLSEMVSILFDLLDDSHKAHKRQLKEQQALLADIGPIKAYQDSVLVDRRVHRDQVVLPEE